MQLSPITCRQVTASRPGLQTKGQMQSHGAHAFIRSSSDTGLISIL